MTRTPKTQKEKRVSKRDPYPRILIVCEGRKTEPLYFQEIRRYLGINPENVVIDGNSPPAPVNVVEHAKQRFKSDGNFDNVYCVMDRDEHTTFEKALQMINTSQKVPPQAIVSIPCFEYWLLLHFEDTARPYARAGDRSPADCVIGDLKMHLPDYSKGAGDTFDKLKGKLDEAIKRSKRIFEGVKEIQTKNPSTQIHILVEVLQNLKN